MWVVKLGGSLGDASELRDWLRELAARARGKVVLVPGGGEFAEQVRGAQRRWGFADAVAHRMALLAMWQTALLWQGLQAGFCACASLPAIREALAGGELPVWLPDVTELDRAGIPATWEASSDSLAAWLAGELHADALVLVKSAALPEVLGDVCSWAERGWVDAAFAGYAARLRCPVYLWRREDWRERLAELPQ